VTVIVVETYILPIAPRAPAKQIQFPEAIARALALDLQSLLLRMLGASHAGFVGSRSSGADSLVVLVELRL
jgi:hypothetical protein